MTTRRRSQEERREEIADTALRIIATRGLTQLTVTTLAGELGITGGALYRHFPSTDAILVAVAARVAERLDETYPDPELPPRAWLERFVLSRAETVSGHEGLSRLLLSQQVALAMPEEAQAYLRGAVAKTFSAIERVIRRGQEDGSIRRDLPAADLTPVVMGTVHLVASARSRGLLRNVISPKRAWATLGTLLLPTSGGAP